MAQRQAQEGYKMTELTPLPVWIASSGRFSGGTARERLDELLNNLSQVRRISHDDSARSREMEEKVLLSWLLRGNAGYFEVQT